MAQLQTYYLNTDAHEVHLGSCTTIPVTTRAAFALGSTIDPQYQHLGRHWNCSSAVHEAMRHVPKTELSKVNGCVHCCRDCHTS